MRIYTAHLRPGAPAVLVPEAFAWGGFLFGPLWLLWHRAWLAAGGTVIALLAALAGSPQLRPVLSLAVLFLVGLVGGDLRRWSLGRGGYALAHVVAGRTADEATLRLIDHDPALTQ